MKGFDITHEIFLMKRCVCCYRSLPNGTVSRGNLILLANTVKNYRPASLLACKHGLLVILFNGREQTLPRWGRKARARVARARVARPESESSLSPQNLSPQNLRELILIDR